MLEGPKQYIKAHFMDRLKRISHDTQQKTTNTSVSGSDRSDKSSNTCSLSEAPLRLTAKLIHHVPTSRFQRKSFS